jgi:hypothetical protein
MRIPLPDEAMAAAVDKWFELQKGSLSLDFPARMRAAIETAMAVVELAKPKEQPVPDPANRIIEQLIAVRKNGSAEQKQNAIIDAMLYGMGIWRAPVFIIQDSREV